MKALTLTFILLLFCLNVFSQNIESICQEIDRLNTQILDGTIKRADAAKRLQPLLANLQKQVRASKSNKPWAFPLAGYTYHAIGGTNGNGYSDRGYNFLDGNKHAAHPAHDIFIKDKDQDCVDDKTGKPVDVHAVMSGYVIACTNNWLPGNAMRGGKFIWVFDDYGNIEYYAHNRQIFVKTGDHVIRGEKIAEVGRTGLNAYKKRSPTHLHFSAFMINGKGIPVPFNPFYNLKHASQ